MLAWWTNTATYVYSGRGKNIVWSQENCTIGHCQARLRGMSRPAYSSAGTIKPNLCHGTVLETKMEEKERKRRKYDTLGLALYQASLTSAGLPLSFSVSSVSLNLA